MEACKLQDRFLERGYTMAMLQDAFKSALCQPAQPVTLSLKFSKQFGKIKGIINKYMRILHLDRDFKEILHTGHRIVARKAPTLGSILAPSFYSRGPKPGTWLQSKGMYKC